MSKKIMVQFTALTFGIMLATWGVMAVIGQFGFTLENHFG
jgi:hypothetical protein